MSDALSGGQDSFLIGGSGNDWLGGRSGGIIVGNSGRDCLMGGTTKDRLSGGSGDDKLCASHASNSVSTMFGGDNFDFSCGSASIIEDVENKDGCLRCFLDCTPRF